MIVTIDLNKWFVYDQHFRLRMSKDRQNYCTILMIIFDEWLAYIINKKSNGYMYILLHIVWDAKWAIHIWLVVKLNLISMYLRIVLIIIKIRHFDIIKHTPWKYNEKSTTTKQDENNSLHTCTCTCILEYDQDSNTIKPISKWKEWTNKY